MKTRNLLAIAAFGGLIAVGGCKGKDDGAADTTGTAAMTDTTNMGAGTAGSMGSTMTDSTAAGMSGTTTDSVTRSMGDTIKR